MAQTLPHFAYLIPVVVFFGIGHQTGVIATIIFAVPPMVRLTLRGSGSKVGPPTSGSADTRSSRFPKLGGPRRKNAQVARDGGDPRPSKRQVPTVAQTLAAVIERDAPTWRHPERTAANWRNVLRRHTSAVHPLECRTGSGPRSATGPPSKPHSLVPSWRLR